MPGHSITRDLKKVINLLPPPEAPSGLERTWEDVEKDLGLALPDDYKAFIDRYGTGLIRSSGLDFAYLGVTNYRAHVDSIKGIKGIIRSYELSRDAGNDSPYPFYPERGGLLPFALTPNGDYFNWRTMGPTRKWDVVLYCFDEGEMTLLERQSFSKVFADLLTQQSVLIPDQIPIEAVTPPFEFTEFNW